MSGTEFGGTYVAICWALMSKSRCGKLFTATTCAHILQRSLKTETDDSKILLRNFINFSIRHIVFHHRHRNLGNCKAVIVRNMIRKIAFFLKSELKTKFSLALVNRKIDSFINTFVIDGILGSIDQNVLTVKDLY